MTNKGIFIGCNEALWGDVIENLLKDKVQFIYISGIGKHIPKQDNLKKNPQTIIHPTEDLYLGKRPKSLDLPISTIDEEILEQFLECEITCRTLCDRQDTGYSFSNYEREQFYFEALEFWLSFFDHYKPSFFICPTTPHYVYDYVCYSVAKSRNVPTLMFYSIASLERILPFTDYKKINSQVLSTYGSLGEGELPTTRLSSGVQGYLKRHSSSHHSEVMPNYLKERLKTKEKVSVYRKIRLFLYKVKTFSFKNLKPKKQEVPVNFLKAQNTAIYKSNGINLEQWRAYKINANNLKKALTSKYNRLTTTFDLEKKFIFVPLQFQPERTSCPEGGRYSNQLLMIKMLSRAIPEGWKIIIKENPSQLLPDTMHGERGRTLYYYNELLDIKNTELVSIETNQLSLIDNCQAVATLTGTSGFEAIVRGKPSLCFGNAWYKGCEGTYSIKTNKDLATAIQSIKSNNTIKKENVIKFLYSLEQHSFKGLMNLRRFNSIEEGIKNNLPHLTRITKEFISSINSSK